MSINAVSPKQKSPLLRERVSDAEWQMRCELAAAHRLVAHFVFVDMTYNHISARVPGEPENFLVKADNVFMEQVKPSKVECAVLLTAGVSLVWLQSIADATVVVQADTGQVLTVRHAYVGDAIAANGGKAKVTFMGPPAEEEV